MTSTELRKVRLNVPREVFDQEKARERPDYTLETPASLPVDPAAREARFVDPVTVIVAVSVAVLAERLLDFALKRRGQGVLVDARQQPPLVSVLAGVPQGFVVLIHPDGKTENLPAEVARTALADVLGNVLAA